MWTSGPVATSGVHKGTTLADTVRTASGNLNLSRIKVWKISGSTVNSGLVGTHATRWKIHHRSGDRKWA